MQQHGIKFTVASSPGSNCQRHRRASGEPSAEMRGETSGGERERRVGNSVYYAAEEFAWELGLTD
ncbi:unnamed protein product [Pleuronectes platessa]|uniref:Uncharacterized protein n=1 Tax=Pleuronectes platessa TaxID=8262 RepID=A0A9N7UH26_PLEPL|nr:unnamed protein product [Pleuronectes platessa]